MEKIFNLIGEASKRIGKDCYIVGGYVRDSLLGIPNNDYDFVVVGHGSEMASEFCKVLKDHGITENPRLEIFENFGTAHVTWDGGPEVEFVGARKESYQRGSRKPIVEEGTLTDDLERRDFTINAIARKITSGGLGDYIDLFDGIQDLHNKILRTPLEPGQTFSDDPLRILRGIRFAVKYNLTVPDNLFKAMTDNRDRLDIISKERIIVELNKIISSPDPYRGMQLLYYSGILKKIIPELTDLDITGKGHKNNMWHSFIVLKKVSEKSTNIWLRWAALLHDIGKAKTERYDNTTGTWTYYQHEFVGASMLPGIFRRLGLPLGSELKYVQLLVSLHMRPGYISTKVIKDSAVRRLLNDSYPYTSDLLLLGECDLSSGRQEVQEHSREHYRKLKEMIADLQERDAIRTFQPVLDGNEIMRIFNLNPGREVGEIKSFIKESILDGLVENNKESLIKYIQEKWKK